VAAARQAVVEADLAAVDDIEATGPDLATMTYEWSLDQTTAAGSSTRRTPPSSRTRWIGSRRRC